MNKAYTSAFDYAYKKARRLVKNPAGISVLLMEVGKKIASGKSSVNDIKTDLLILVRLVTRWTKGEYKNVSTKTIISIIASMLYFLNPLDIIPDFIPIIGFTDDATVLLYVLNRVGKEVDEFKNWERLNTVNKVK